jgi:hypothetical protein
MSEAKQYRKKPIEAMQWTGKDEDIADILDWTNRRAFIKHYHDERNALFLRQPVGNKMSIAVVAKGDWIIKGYDGETFYICPAELFSLTFDEVTNE